jgi:hypothetical protein
LARFFWHRNFIIIVVQIPFAIPLGHFFYLQITVANTLYIACRIRYLKRLMMQITGLIQYYGFCGTNEFWKNNVCSSVE